MSDVASADEWHPSSKGARGAAPDHTRRTWLLLGETWGITVLLFGVSLYAASREVTWVAWLLAVPRGLWIQRHYCVGHEAAHGKLFPGRPLLNDALGQLALFALLTPIRVFRKIHRFHHGHNRRDLHTSALDVIWIRRDTFFRRLLARVQWFVAAYGCGWFWHGLVSILLFLGSPLSLAERISPAFRGWTARDRAWSITAFAVAAFVHVVWLAWLDVSTWLVLFGAPLVVFSWIYSAQLYIYHYDTSIGPEVTQHARSLGGPLVNWWLLSLNEHAMHHRRPAIVWYALRDAAARERVEAAGGDLERRSFVWGIVNQLRGPRIVVRTEASR